MDRMVVLMREDMKGKPGAPSWLSYMANLSGAVSAIYMFVLPINSASLVVAIQALAATIFLFSAPFYWKMSRGIKLTFGFWISAHAGVFTVLVSSFWKLSERYFDGSFWVGLLFGGAVAFYGLIGLNSANVAQERGWSAGAFMILTYLISPIIMVIVILLLPRKNPTTKSLSVSPDVGFSSDLAELAKLHELGKLSDSEFERAKKRILG